MPKILSALCRERRKRWIAKIAASDGHFQERVSALASDLEAEIASDGLLALLDHVRCASVIPESYGHDSTEEKLYAKYTDILLSASYNTLGMQSVTLDGRGDTADVEVFAQDYAFVADAKTFRLSRTAKNQKDFKVTALAKWKYHKPYAMLVAPLYQFPSRKSQIYQQAIEHHVCLFSYAHLAVVLAFAQQAGNTKCIQLLKNIFKSISTLTPLSSALHYWNTVNTAMLKFDVVIEELWSTEKIATREAIEFAKEEALAYLAQERERIIRLPHADALRELIFLHRIDSRYETISSVNMNDIMNL